MMKNVGGHWFTWEITAVRGGNRTKQKEEERQYFLIPPRESSPWLCPLWADSSEGLSTAGGHLSHSKVKRAKDRAEALRSDIWVQSFLCTLHCTYLGSQQRTKSALVSPQWFRCSIVISTVAVNKNKENTESFLPVLQSNAFSIFLPQRHLCTAVQPHQTQRGKTCG